jgi:hypothetical protein
MSTWLVTVTQSLNRLLMAQTKHWSSVLKSVRKILLAALCSDMQRETKILAKESQRLTKVITVLVTRDWKLPIKFTWWKQETSTFKQVSIVPSQHQLSHVQKPNVMSARSALLTRIVLMLLHVVAREKLIFMAV